MPSSQQQQQQAGCDHADAADATQRPRSSVQLEREPSAAAAGWGEDAAVQVVRRPAGPSIKQHAGQDPAQQQHQHQQQPAAQGASPLTWLLSARAWPHRLLWDVLLPSSTLSLLWDAFMVVLVLYLAVLLPFAVAFGIHYTDLSNPWARFDLAASMLFLFDVWMNFRTAYIDDDGHLVRQRSRIAASYVRSWFVFDTLSSIPYEQLVTISAYGITAAVSLLKIVRLVRIIKIVRLLKLLRMARIDKLSRLESVVGQPMMQLATLAASVALLLHWVACVWFYTAVVTDDGTGWVAAEGLSGEGHASNYVTSLYFAISTAATIGFGDIVAQTLREKVVGIFIMLLGASVFGYVMGAMSLTVQARNSTRTRMAAKKRAVDDFITHRRVPRVLADRVRDYYGYVVEREIAQDESDIIAGLSANLRMQVVLHIYQAALEKVPFFRGQHPQFITSVVTLLKLEFFSPGDVVVRQGAVGQELYFVAAGDCEVRLYCEDEGGPALSHPAFKRRQTRGSQQRGEANAKWAFEDELAQKPYKVVGQLRAGEDHSYFGEHSCLLGEEQATTVVATSYVELYSLSRADLELVLCQYPEVVEEFSNMVSKEGGTEPPGRPASPALDTPQSQRWNIMKAAQQHPHASPLPSILHHQQTGGCAGSPAAGQPLQQAAGAFASGSPPPRAPCDTSASLADGLFDSVGELPCSARSSISLARQSVPPAGPHQQLQPFDDQPQQPPRLSLGRCSLPTGAPLARAGSLAREGAAAELLRRPSQMRGSGMFRTNSITTRYLFPGWQDRSGALVPQAMVVTSEGGGLSDSTQQLLRQASLQRRSSLTLQSLVRPSQLPVPDAGSA